jgi:hypothetical protein
MRIGGCINERLTPLLTKQTPIRSIGFLSVLRFLLPLASGIFYFSVLSIHADKA